MLEFKQGTGTSTLPSEHGNQSMPRRGSSLHSRSSSLGSVRCSSSRPSGFHSPLPSDGFEPQADVVLRPSALHLAERIFKRLMKLRKKALLASSCFPLDPLRATLEGGACVRSHSLGSVVDVERGYETDEQFGFVSMDTPPSSSSSSSSMGSSSFESLGSHQVSAVKRAHKPGSQMMAKMLLSLLEEEAGRFTVEEEDECGSGDEEHQFGGPRESAWHQPEEEFLTDMEWRMMRYGHPQSKSVAALAATKRLQSCCCNKYLAMGEYSSSKLQRNIDTASHNNSSSTRLKRVTWKLM